MAIDFVSERVTRALESVIHDEEYVAISQSALSREQELNARLSADERKISMEIEDQKGLLSCRNEEACYMQGFRDVVRIMAGLPLE